jgi:hypothetical protein
MHRALLLEDVLARVVDESGPDANYALARTCRSFTDLALDGLWADQGEVDPWQLAGLMPIELCTVSKSPLKKGARYTTVHMVSPSLRSVNGSS